MEKELLETLQEMRQAQQDLLAKQDEMLAFLRAESEKAKTIREEALAMQRRAVKRAKHVGYLAFPAILLCVVLLVYLLVKYPIL